MAEKRIAVVRFSALGDVALLWPVLRQVAESYPDYKITFFTRPAFLRHLPDHPGIEKVGLDVDTSYASPVSLFLFWWGWLRGTYPEAWVDAHAHVRTQTGTWLAARFGARVGKLEKHRALRKAFLAKKVEQLPAMQENYADAFAQAGFPIVWPVALPSTSRPSSDILLIAPFAAHESKRWPLESAYALVVWWQELGGKAILMGHFSEIDQWNGPDIEFARPDQEASLWEKAAVAVVTDSANQHLAALHGTPSVTLWMGTAPEAGFVPAHSGGQEHVQPSGISCSPCSIYGTSRCSRGDFACRQLPLNQIQKAIAKVARTDLPLHAL